MIVKEVYAVRRDGVTLYRTYSDIGVYITRDGEKYADAVDPEDQNRVYEETDELIPVEYTSSEEEEEHDE